MVSARQLTLGLLSLLAVGLGLSALALLVFLVFEVRNLKRSHLEHAG